MGSAEQTGIIKKEMSIMRKDKVPCETLVIESGKIGESGTIVITNKHGVIARIKIPRIMDIIETDNEVSVETPMAIYTAARTKTTKENSDMTFDDAHIMPCQSIQLDSHTLNIGKPVQLNIVDMNGVKTEHKMTKTPVVDIKLWSTGDIRYIQTELGVYTQNAHTNKFDNGKPKAVVHFYSETDGSVASRHAYNDDLFLCNDLREYFIENGTNNIIIYVDRWNEMTHQRIINVALAYAGKRPNIGTYQNALTNPDFVLI